MFPLIFACVTPLTTRSMETDLRPPVDALLFEELQPLDSMDQTPWGAADLDGDGDEDLYGFDRDHRVLVWEARGGSLEAPRALSEGLGEQGWARKLDVADLDGDGRVEFLLSVGISAGSTWTEQVWTVDLDGNRTVLAEGSSAVACALADIDQDGASELVLVTDQGAELRLSSGAVHALPEALTWTWNPHAIAVPGGIVLLNDGGYGIYQVWLVDAEGRVLVERQDIYGSDVLTDGSPFQVASEVIVNSWGSAWRLLDADGSMDFHPMSLDEGLQLGVSGEFDGREGADLLGWDNERSRAWVNAELTELPIDGLHDTTWGLIAADIDGDGLDDVARVDWTDEGSVLRVWLNVSR